MSEGSYIPLAVGEGYFSDWQPPISADDGKTWVWNHAQQKYVPQALSTGVTDHALLTHLDFASSGHTGFEQAGAGAGAVATHVGLADPHSQYLLSSNYTAADVLAKLLTVDGSGSGLDADLLGGLSSAAFATSGHNHGGTYQPLDDELTAIAGLVSVANTVPSFTGSGTAALLTVGTAANNLVKLDGSAKLPAVDGSQLTNLPGASGTLLADGTVTGATSRAQAFTNGVRIARGITGLGLIDNYFGLDFTPFVYQVNTRDDYGMVYFGSSGSSGLAGTGAYQVFVASRTVDGDTPSALSNNDVLAFFQFYGDDGASLVECADFVASVDGSVSGGIVPGRFDFYTMDSTGTSAPRLSVCQDGKVGIGTSTPIISDGIGLDINGKILRLRAQKTPASASATGNAGEICADSNYIYYCTAANTWKRSAIATW